MLNRRAWFRSAAGSGAALALAPRLLQALEPLLASLQGTLLKKAIPATGEMLPVIGLGSSATFASVARGEEVSALKEVFRAMVDRGATLFDTAPSYGASEQVAGQIVNELGIADKMFWATKLNAAGRGAGATTDPAAARAQVERSFELLKRPKIDLIQVHNMSDVPTHLGILKDYKKQGRVRYIGVTTTFEPQYPGLIEVMRNEPLDFIGIDYAADNRQVEEVILPLAQERKIAVLAYAPFGRTSLFRRIGDRPLPDWAAGFDAATWAQLLLKFVISHPAITAVTPATSQARHMLDNIGGGVGRLPDAATRQRIIEFVDALPPAPPRGR
jgi:aryl-alcohol dehydrogenase-like predicted oxidoreductase